MTFNSAILWCRYPATAAVVDGPNPQSRVAIHFTVAISFSQVSSSAFLLRFRIRRRIYCTNKSYFKRCVETPLGSLELI